MLTRLPVFWRIMDCDAAAGLDPLFGTNVSEFVSFSYIQMHGQALRVMLGYDYIIN